MKSDTLVPEPATNTLNSASSQMSLGGWCSLRSKGTFDTDAITITSRHAEENQSHFSGTFISPPKQSLEKHFDGHSGESLLDPHPLINSYLRGRGEARSLTAMCWRDDNLFIISIIICRNFFFSRNIFVNNNHLSAPYIGGSEIPFF